LLSSYLQSLVHFPFLRASMSMSMSMERAKSNNQSGDSWEMPSERDLRYLPDFQHHLSLANLSRFSTVTTIKEFVLLTRTMYNCYVLNCFRILCEEGGYSQIWILSLVRLESSSTGSVGSLSSVLSLELLGVYRS